MIFHQFSQKYDVFVVGTIEIFSELHNTYDSLAHWDQTRVVGTSKFCMKFYLEEIFVHIVLDMHIFYKRIGRKKRFEYQTTHTYIQDQYRRFITYLNKLSEVTFRLK